MTLRLYIMRLMAVRTLIAAVVLLAILQILDLLDITTQVLNRGLGLQGLGHYALLRLPALFRQIAPLSVLIGVVFAFLQLARDNAVVAMRAAGISLYQLALMGVPIAGAVAVADLVVIQTASSQAQLTLDTWWNATAPPGDRAEAKVRPFRVGADVVLARQSGLDGRRLDDVRIYERNGDGELTRRIVASSAVYTDHAWRLHQPTFTRLGKLDVVSTSAGQMMWTNSLRPVDVQALFAPNRPLTTGAARRALAGGPAERPAAFYLTQLNRLFAEPLGALVMLLLAMPAAFVDFRAGSGIRLTSIGLGGGLVYLVCDGLMTALAETGALPSVVGAWFAPVLFLAAAATTVLYLEG
ncbi:MAG: LptF/LptG family permease [Caulobacteraceae bacterium]